MTMQPFETHQVMLVHYLARLTSWSILQTKTELSIFIPSHYIMMCFRFNTRRDTHEHVNFFLMFSKQLIKQFNLMKIINDDTPNIIFNRHLQFLCTFIISM